MPRFLKAIRLDISDVHVFPQAAEPGEPVLPGAFVFHDVRPEDLAGKLRQAFVSGFLSLETFGWTTLATPVDLSDGEIEALTLRLAEHFMSHYGAPSMEAALPVARQEIQDTVELASGLAINALLAVKRERDETGAMREAFHLVTPSGEKPHACVWDVEED
ncbi:hypothetical protein H2509_05715 [Stappia sp. F7233]|uniref:Uncharacterized protein n=1 Tax=Stappia albiluteola TaxID=2758565 RepID=A0A839AAD9_9HYPH|nr:DUF6505 family protein [Stappia albiluteola]MBA5776620.1 hypothetical protein [Stappia albiluteola]